MPHEPKRRHSTGRKGKRRASIKLVVASLVSCPNCAQMTLPHIVCKFCGYYKGQEIIKKESKAKVTKMSQEK